jgi:formate hydrogenlyase subunit 4
LSAPVTTIIAMPAAVLLSPLLVGVVNKTKALFAGRSGPPLLQMYRDLAKLSRKGAVYSRTTTVLFRAGPIVGLAAVVTALALVPSFGARAPVAFPGDVVLLAYLLALARFVTVLAALDTGSSFEGMGASREVQFAALTEPALLLGLAAIARETGSLSVSGMLATVSGGVWSDAGPALALVAAALLVVFLAENSRIPFDDPNTHLELTMVHEVMILDHGGPDLALIEMASAVKMWILGGILVTILVPAQTGSAWYNAGTFLIGMLGLAVLTGIVESSMARLRLTSIPQLLIGAGALSALALILGLWR